MTQPPAVVLPLSPAQEGVLFESLTAKRHRAHLTRVDVAVRGRLDLDLMWQAWRIVGSRRSALRAALRWSGSGLPLHVVNPDPCAPRADAVRDFDIRPGPIDIPLVRFQVEKAGAGANRITLEYHHLALDAWSVGVLLSELIVGYHLLADGRSFDLTDDLPAYTRYFRSQTAAMEMRTRTHAPFWRSQLESHQLPFRITDCPLGEPAKSQIRYIQHCGSLSATASLALTESMKELRLSLGAFAHTCWAIVLSRHTARRRVLFGSVFSGRSNNEAETTDLVGLQARALPVSVDVSPGQSFRALAQKVQSRLLELQEHEDASLVEILAWTRSRLAEGPLFDTALALALMSDDGSDWLQIQERHGIRLGEIGTEERPPHALTLYLSAGQPVTVYGIGRSDLISERVVEQLTLEFVRTLEACAKEPGLRILETTAP